MSKNNVIELEGREASSDPLTGLLQAGAHQLIEQAVEAELQELLACHAEHHPAAFCCALLNSQPMGFYAPAQLIKDAQRHGVKVLPVDVGVSSYDCNLELSDSCKPTLRLGFNQIKGLSKKGAIGVSESRREKAFATVQDLVFRSGISKKDLESLAAADALRKLSGDRHRAFWQASGVENSSGSNLFDFADSDFGIDVLLPVATESQNIIGDYAATGFTLRRHPVALLREHLDNYQVSRADELGKLENEGFAKVTGIVTCRQRPMTAAGVTFVTLEDESGFVNVVIWPGLGEKHRPVVRRAVLLGVIGHVQISEGVIHLIASELVDLSSWLGSMRLTSRDFT